MFFEQPMLQMQVDKIYLNFKENYHNEKWFHVNCFKYLPAKVNKANVEDIEGYDNLTPSD